MLPVYQVLGCVYGQTREELEARVHEEEGVADEAYRRVGGGAWDDWVKGCGRHAAGLAPEPDNRRLVGS